MDKLPFHRETTVHVAANPQTVFELLNDHQRLAAHMEKPSLMMAGATMKITTDRQKGQALGSLITVKGHVLGMALSVSEKVTEYAPPLRKAWETIGDFARTPTGKWCGSTTCSKHSQPIEYHQQACAHICKDRHPHGRAVEQGGDQGAVGTGLRGGGLTRPSGRAFSSMRLKAGRASTRCCHSAMCGYFAGSATFMRMA